MKQYSHDYSLVSKAESLLHDVWQESEEYWEWNVVDRTEKAMQLPRQWAEEDKKNEQEQQQQYSRGRGWGR